MKFTSILFLVGMTGFAAALPQASQPARPSDRPSGSVLPPRPSGSGRPVPSGVPSGLPIPSDLPALPSGRPSGPAFSGRPSRTGSAGPRPTPSGVPVDDVE
ncbi:hypothetical protein ACN47E_001837 [Coniothyrium glycines]